MNKRKRQFERYMLYYPTLSEIQRFPERLKYVNFKKYGNRIVGLGVSEIRSTRFGKVYLVETPQGVSFTTGHENLFPMNPTEDQVVKMAIRLKILALWKKNPPKKRENQGKFVFEGVRGVDYCLVPEDRPYDHPLSVEARKREKLAAIQKQAKIDLFSL